jgi:hypothetical protein
MPWHGSGKRWTGRVAQVDEPAGDLAERLLQFDFGLSWAGRPPLLSWCGPTAPRHVPAKAATLAPAQLAVAHDAASKLASAFVTRRDPAVPWSLGSQEVRSVAGTPLAIVTTPLQLEFGDDRGHVFQAIDRQTGTVRWQAFGHPEWLSGDVGVREVTGDVFFRLPGTADVLMLGRHGTGWESFGHGIYKLTTGELLAESF